MPARFEIKGRDQFLADLRALPETLHAEGKHMVEGSANGAGATIKAGYSDHRVTGNLAAHVKVEIEEFKAAIIAEVKSTAPHAFIFEHGTRVRKTKKNANRGAMWTRKPKPNIFVPAMVRARTLLTNDLIGLLERAGLVVRRV